MISIQHGDVLNIEQGIIVHGCNCNGVMGAGIALQIKNRFPAAFESYSKKYQTRGLFLGEITVAQINPSKIIVNANTQQNTGANKRQVNYEAIAECFEKVLLLANETKEYTGERLDIVFPMIGAGLGGGNWNIIESIIDETIPDEFNKILYKFP